MEKILHIKMQDMFFGWSSILSPPRTPPVFNIAVCVQVDPPVNGKNLAYWNLPRCQKPTLKVGVHGGPLAIHAPS